MHPSQDQNTLRDGPEMDSVRGTCQRFRVSRSTLYRLMRDQKISASKCLGKTLVDQDSFRRLLASSPALGNTP